jgi:hypothetical protein
MSKRKWLKEELLVRGPMTRKQAREAAGAAGYSTNGNTFAQCVIGLNIYGPDEDDHRGSTMVLHYWLAPGQTLSALSSTVPEGRVLAELSTDPIRWDTLKEAANVCSSGLLQVRISALRRNHDIKVESARYITLVIRESTAAQLITESPQPRSPSLPTLRFQTIPFST